MTTVEYVTDSANVRGRADLCVRVPLSVRRNSGNATVLPVTVGVPLAAGTWRQGAVAIVFKNCAARAPCQTNVLARWCDGSVKWLLATFLMPPDLSDMGSLVLTSNSSRDEMDDSVAQVTVRQLTDGELVVSTGTGDFRLATGDNWLTAYSTSTSTNEDAPVTCRLQWTDAIGTPRTARVDRLEVRESGPVRVIVDVEGTLGRKSALRFCGNISFFANSNQVRSELTTQNPRRARHSGGYWDLGDPGSVFVKSLSVTLETPPCSAPMIAWLDEPNAPLRKTRGDTFEIYQDSSGGRYWQSHNHINRHGRVPLRFKGYKVRTVEGETNGERARPVVCVAWDKGYVACALEEFWQKFPSAIEVNRQSLSIHLWPPQFADVHELQAGEHCTRIMWLDFGSLPEGSCERLAWIHDPPQASVDPAAIAASGAVPFFPKLEIPSRPELQNVLDEALAGDHSLFAKRECIDEYGWRNFGDVWADHEEAYADDPLPVISHYNNQYDLLHGLLIQYLLSGDCRWWALADPLARHVMDIDIYHTNRDKPAYNGGLFWHTAHYHQAGTSTHRCMSALMKGKKIPAPGTGPCNEHNYASGLLLYHYLSGCRRAKATVLGLADWVIAMDDGRRSLLGIASHQPTGAASRTFSDDYHGPGRGAGNSINALVDAWQLSAEERYLTKAEEIIRRCCHPHDNITARDLGNAEVRWSYTVFLQSLVRFMELTCDRKELQALHAYVRESVLHYARWMAEHERFYLDVPEKLEYPTETWAAQELRKGAVLLMAARYTTLDEGDRFRIRGREILDRGWQSLLSFPTRNYTRPLALVLQQGCIETYLNDPCLASFRSNSCEELDIGLPSDFVSQKKDIRRAVRSPFGVCRMFWNACRPTGWWNAWQQTWIAECLRWH